MALSPADLAGAAPPGYVPRWPQSAHPIARLAIIKALVAEFRARDDLSREAVERLLDAVQDRVGPW